MKTMQTTRREFLKVAAATGVGTLLPWRRAYASAQSPSLRKFIQTLPGLGPSGIPVATSVPYLGADYYRLTAGEYTQQLHPQLSPTRLWGYADTTTGVYRHLGPVVVAQRGTPVRLTLTNQLPPIHPLPVDTSLPGAELPPNRTALHLHGGHTPWLSDGGPFSWFGADGSYGPSAVSAPDMGVPAPGTFNYYYPNDQSARLVWYHDHALGITRLNAYAGLASAYVMRDLDECLLHRGLQIAEAHLARLDRYRAGLDLGEVEDVVDQLQQVGTRAVDGRGEFDLFGRQVAFGVLGHQPGKDEHAVERCAQLM